MLEVALVGTGGMMPLPNRFLASFICRLKGRNLLIDCGECTQVSLKMLGWGFKNIDVICFTHFHADHISGLTGLLLTIGNSGRDTPVKLIGPFGLERVVRCLLVIAQELPFDLEIVEIDPDNIPGEDNPIVIEDFNIRVHPMEHHVRCYGYSVTVTRAGKFDPERAAKLGLPKLYWSVLQRGENVEYEGKIFNPEQVLGQERKGIKVCYCTDSRPPKRLAEFIKGADLFVCEGIYGEDEKLKKAIEHRHMIFSEAAQIAKNGCVKEMWLTHYSPSLTDPEYFLPWAKNIFPNTIAGYDRMNKTLMFEENI